MSIVTSIQICYQSICLMVTANDQGGNYISYVGSGLKGNHELRMLDLSENFILMLQNLEDLGLRTLSLAQNKLSSLEGGFPTGKTGMQKWYMKIKKDRAQAASLGKDAKICKDMEKDFKKMNPILSVRHLHSFAS